jgi:hypothetical protein
MREGYESESGRRGGRRRDGLSLLEGLTYAIVLRCSLTQIGLSIPV